MSSPEPPLAGATPDVWDRIHESNREEIHGGVYSLASAPERAMLRAAIAHCDLHPGAVVAELGCGSSRYLPQLASATGADVAGVDFSEMGIAQTRRALEAVGAATDGIELGRIEEWTPRHADEFDAVISFGLVEHFDDLDEIVRQHFACTRPGGRVCIAAPNLSSVNLAWARATAPGVMSWHRPISVAAVAASCERSGGRVVAREHLGGPRLFAYPDVTGARAVAARSLRKLVNGAGEALDRASPAAAAAVAGRVLSPYFVVAAIRAG
jgi:SAM-dependent methyltransferase